MTNLKPQKMTTVCEVLTSQRNMFAHVMLAYICIILIIYFVIYTLVAFPLEILKVQRKVYHGMTPNKNLILIITILERNLDFEVIQSLISLLAETMAQNNSLNYYSC